MKKFLLFLSVITLSTMLVGGKHKIKVPGGKDVYVPTLEGNGKDLEVLGGLSVNGSGSFIQNLKTSGSFTADSSITLTAGTHTDVDVTGKTLIIIDASSGSVTVNGLKGGVLGQRVTFLKASSSPTSNYTTIQYGGAIQPILFSTFSDFKVYGISYFCFEVVYSDVSNRWIADSSSIFATGTITPTWSLSSGLVEAISSVALIWERAGNIVHVTGSVAVETDAPSAFVLSFPISDLPFATSVNYNFQYPSYRYGNTGNNGWIRKLSSFIYLDAFGNTYFVEDAFQSWLVNFTYIISKP
jgi:hypothetical protein